MMFTFPFFIACKYISHKKELFCSLCLIQIIGFIWVTTCPTKNPTSDPALNKAKVMAQKSIANKTFFFDLQYMTPYAKLQKILSERRKKEQHTRLEKYFVPYLEKVKKRDPDATITAIPTLWYLRQEHIANRKKTYQLGLSSDDPKTVDRSKMRIQYIHDQKQWTQNQNKKISFIIWPLLRQFHWEDDAGGEQLLNQVLPWWKLTRVNHKDLLSSLIFGIRISLVVGLLAIALALMIGVPVGAFAGYYGGRVDIIVSRLLEIWESMPTFFMLLLFVSITHNKSIFLVISVIGLFGWTGFSRYIRAEFFKQRNLSYVEACRAQGFSDSYTIFNHILPNAIPPLLTLLPFAIMGAITSEAGLSFLGLGEEGSCSWGVLMDEGRAAFPAESYLLWPPAILLTTMLVSIALIGDALRDILDPKLRK